MRNNRNLLNYIEGYCGACETEKQFRYVSTNVASAGQPETHFYACECGNTYPLDKLLNIRNAHRIVTMKKE